MHFLTKSLFYHYFEDIVNPHDYLNELNEMFKKYNYFEKFCCPPQRIYFFYELDEKNILIILSF